MKRLAAAGLAAAAAMAAHPVTAGAASIPVTTGADEFGTAGAGCSLREAVESANTGTAFGGCTAGESPGGDTITLVPGVTHTLTIPGNGEDLNATGDLDASTADGPLTIAAAGAGARPTVEAGFPATGPQSNDRLLDVAGSGDLTVSGVTLTGGFVESGAGGAIRWRAPSSGDLTVTGSVLTANSAELVGAIAADTTGVHTIEDSELSGNLAFDLGAIRSTGELRVVRTAVIDNIGGGVIAQKAGPASLELTASTIAGNRIGADLSVGGVFAEGEATIVNSTITGNLGGFVGGVEVGAPATISFSTIAENGAPGSSSGFVSGGIGTESGTTVTLSGVILSGNQAGLQADNCGDGVSVAEGPEPNLESADTCGLSAAGGALVNASADLAPLAANGGPAPTRGLYPGSAALDAGGAACTPVSDQRGAARPAGAACDLGAFEGTVARPPPETGTAFPQPAAPSPPAPAPKKCGKKRKLAKNGRCVKRKKAKKRKRSKGRVAGAHERVVIGRTVRGRKIVASRVGDPDGERVALVVGVIHGDERAGLAVLDRIAASELDGVRLWVIPSLNPDGQRARQRRNARGVDLNRNFPFRWKGGAPPTSGYYPGRSPASEPETKAAMRFIERIKPQVSVWYHQPWGAVLACKGNPEAAFRYARLAGMRTSCRGRSLRGTAISWQRHALRGSQAFVVELGARGLTQRIARRHARALATIAADAG